MPDTPTPAEPATRSLDACIERTRDDLRRADATAGAHILVLLGLGSIIAELGADLPRTIAIAVLVATIPAAVTTGLALAVVRPRVIHSLTPGSWPHDAHQPGWTHMLSVYADADDTEMLGRQLWTLSRIVAAKVHWLRRATIALVATLAYLVAVALYGAVTALI